MQNKSPLSTLIQSQAERYGKREALRYRDYKAGVWKRISWEVFARRVTLASNALVELGVEPQENVATFMQNTPEGLTVDFACYGVRAVVIPFYATSSEAQVKYMVSDANIRYIFVGEQYQYDTAFRVLQFTPCIKRLIIVDPDVKRHAQDNTSITFAEFLAMGDGAKHQAEVDKRTAALQPDDLANILYTSGTTGLSKGVMLTHRMFQAAIAAHEHVIPLTDQDLILNFLPFTHVFERAWAYLCLATGCTLAINLRPQDIQMTMKEVHPTCMCAVPRFWEKVYSGVQEKIATSSPMQRSLMQDALKVGKIYNVDYKMQGKQPPLALKLKYKFYEKTIISVLLKVLGLERGNFFPTAGAAIPPAVEEFIHAVGIRMIAGYGMTETTATVTCDHWDKRTSIGSVGRLMPGIEMKIGENNEVLLKGETMTKGYYRKAEVTANTIDADGWLHTGDAGYVKDGELFLTERIKDLFKTSNGKYIAPQLLESKLCVDRYIDQIVIIADQRKFVSALVIPEYTLLEKYAQEHGIGFTDRADLCRDERINALFMERIETLQQEFAHYEQVKCITLLPENFSMEKGELTNTLKVKRPVINERYKAQIEAMYAE
ncbi:MAG: long-chain fatty acid--CoA ligase [Bacteroidaceae bacterium]|nr:long-chain fatty acid--CoA ligase [Bacteroidaceae bacterium]